jgi:hypothetical protein
LPIAFSFSMAETRYDMRRSIVLEEANAIGSTANSARMLPEPAQKPVLSLLRDHTCSVRSVEDGARHNHARCQAHVRQSDWSERGPERATTRYEKSDLAIVWQGGLVVVWLAKRGCRAA